MDEATPIQSEAGTVESSPKTLIDKLREEYHDAMNLIDVQSGAEIKSGQEMKGIMTFSTAANKLTEIHEQLSTFYGALFQLSELLKRNDSQRLKQLGHDMLPTLELIRNLDATDEVKDQVLVNQFHEIGLRKRHWYFKERFLLEIEYMLDSLSILIEPDFMPISEASGSSTAEEVDRYISSEVKLNVWRRDQGKCVECGSKEKLEYDHIIPISKGGSNTERNIQLLCQTCNRKKAAGIQ
ncbi:MAG TPA: HNH endonuclease signature motif containing protein [Syntrophales bacterium]|nr:HNH endonuclease signature motif containing protein [Thermodesulfobacteriota bacterium]HPX81681.1 HNH endonuclease signature motif containing protein [Syntrophales bacterium]